MRYLLLLLLISFSLFGAEINKTLFSENNATQEIQRLRMIILDNVTTDPEIQNNISIQKLFLSKIETLATKVPKDEIKPYPLPKTKKISQKEFLKYFDSVALKIHKMHQCDENELILHERLSLIKKRLKDLAPEYKDEILQAQLEYAYFKWKNIYNERRKNRYHDYLEKEKIHFLAVFKKVKVDVKVLEKEGNKQNIALQKLYQKKVYLELRLEKEAILLASKKKDELLDDVNQTKSLTELAENEKNWQYKFVKGELTEINQKISKKIKEKNGVLLLTQINNLQNENLENYIIVRSIMESFSNDLSIEDKKLFVLEQKMLEWLKYQFIGDMTAVMYDFQAWIEHSYSKVLLLINKPLFYQNDKPVVLFDFIKMFFTIFIGFMIAKFYKHRVNAAQKRINFIQKQSFKIIGNIGYYLIVIVTFAVSLHNIGLDLSSLSLVAGALSVGIGFGLKEVVGNFVSGIILMVERSVKIGDFVEIDNDVSGNIIDIRMRSVTIKTSANIDVVVPNSDLVQKSFTNYTLEEPVRRLSIPFKVAYGVSFEEVSEVIMTALTQSELNFVRDVKEYENEVIMTGLEENGVGYILFVFVRTYGPNARSSFFRLIYKALNENNLPIPFPQLDVSMKEKS